jgi:hypothetical protein
VLRTVAPAPARAWEAAQHIAPLAGAAGAGAALLSAATLLWRGRAETGSPFAPLNAPSQWLWGRDALQHDGADLKHTATGAVTHGLSSLLWGALFGAVQLWRRRPTPASVVLDAAAVTAVAAVVDLKLVPDRLTPGFEKRLTPAGTAMVYAAFGVGLAVGGLWLSRRR